MCQQMKNHPQQPFGLPMPNKVPNGPWKIISTNLITQLPKSNSYNAERVQKGIAYWDKQNNDVPAPNCMLKVQGEIIKDKGL